MNTLAERMQNRMNDLGITQEQLAEKADISQTTVSNVLSGITKKPRNLIEIATALEVDPAWLQSGIGEAPENRTALPALVSANPDITHRHRIDYYDVRAAAGLIGFENSDYPEIISTLFLTDEGMAQLVGKKTAAGISIVNVPTDSMEPTIRKGDIVFLDTNINAYHGDGIYAFMIDGALFIKRVQKLVGGGYRLHSDNKDYDPQDISDDLCQTAHFIGRFIRTVHIDVVNL